MKYTRRLRTLALAALLALEMFAPICADTVTDYVLYTEIRTSINGVEISSYNIRGYTAVIVEDLAAYGFDVTWDGENGILSAARNAAKAITGMPAETVSGGAVGARAMPVYETAIRTFFDGREVEAFNVGGRTIVYMDTLAEMYAADYRWIPEEKALKAVWKGAPATPASAALTIAENGASDFTLVCSGDAPDSIKNALPKLASEIQAKTSVSLKTDTDKTAPDGSRREILVGATDRAASGALLAALPAHSYGIRVTEDAVVIAGASDSLTALALYEFEETILNGEENYASEGRFSLPVGLEILRTDVPDDVSSILASSRPFEASLSDPTEIFWPSGFLASEGSTTDGTYFYTAFICYADAEKTQTVGVIVKTRISDGEVVKRSRVLPIDHANDMCYNPDDNVLVSCNTDRNILTVIDPETLEVIDRKDGAELGFIGCFGIAYDTVHQQYVTKGNGKIAYLTLSFRQKAAVSPEHYRNESYTAQAQDTDGTLVLSLLSPGANVRDNIVIVNKRSGEYLYTFSIPMNVEGEGLFHDADGQYYFACNNWQTRKACVYRLSLSYVYK